MGGETWWRKGWKWGVRQSCRMRGDLLLGYLGVNFREASSGLRNRIRINMTLQHLACQGLVRSRVHIRLGVKRYPSMKEVTWKRP